MNKQARLDQIRADILERDICPNLAETAHQLVLGDGNPDADIVFIGEAPGKKEDETGLPFVGAAGKFLNQLLESVGLERGDTYVTNIVKYRPPNNRDPSAEEKAAFLPYLLEQLSVIEPKIIVTLGRHSMEYFLPKARIGDVHGQPQRLSQIAGIANSISWTLVPLYHPAAALYNGSLRATLYEDMQLLASLLSDDR